MSMNILLPIATYPDVTSKVGLGYALGLSARLSASVTAIVQEVDIAPINSALGEALLGLSKMAADAEAHSRENGASMGLWLRERAQNLGVDLDVRTVRCRPEAFADGLVPLSRHHDLAIAVLDGSDPQRRADTEALIFDSGGPVLVVPLTAVVPVAEQRAAPFNVIVAWDGGRAASRALRDAMPLLVLADLVSILTVGDDKVVDPAGIAGVQALLDHHGVRNKHLHQERGTASTGDTLQAVAVNHDANLLVMGAYGRNRLQEFVLGGATRSVLHGPRLPILLSH
ncbi:universal stress protein [Devosia sp. SL43]|uniref:universal stress protein n=1 Tax=Devosia sp. SL43 TaxID=2806348 RepID=UPI001F1BA379|nr:universal stress protein [Devosia sp. SL43]UJW85661.1 universal stress protein [Devosia sp. SL43]